MKKICEGQRGQAKENYQDKEDRVLKILSEKNMLKAPTKRRIKQDQLEMIQRKIEI
jgi:hypothetical protein